MTQKPLYIFDGYNLIKRIDALRREEIKSLEQGRQALLVHIATFRNMTNHDAVVVFDGKKMSLQVKSGVRILFSNLPNRADEAIKRLVDDQAKARTITVVSSDNEVMWYAQGCGCRVERSEDFFQRLTTLKNKPVSDELSAKNDPSLSEREMDYWRSMFEHGE
ncbi:NYN domain-containing protein [bacterium]|nr:NYN domain-containing protein [bacterium]NUN45854.1 NYN domain-containing protein [bacterium]